MTVKIQPLLPSCWTANQQLVPDERPDSSETWHDVQCGGCHTTQYGRVNRQKAHREIFPWVWKLSLTEAWSALVSVTEPRMSTM